MIQKPPGNPRCSKKVSSNESRWFLVFSAKSRNLLFSRIPYTNPLWVLCAIFPELRCAFGPLVGCPLILVKTEKIKKMWKKRWKSAVFFRMRRAYPRSPDALCAANSWILDGFGMLADAGIDSFQTFTPIWLDHQSRWFLFQAMIFGPKSRKSIVFAKATRN